MRACYLTGLIMLALFVGVARASAAAEDRHAGYYYPEPVTTEVYRSEITTLAQADRAMRIGFVTGLANQMLGRPYPPEAAIFAKGDEGQKLIVVALIDGSMDTIYRARGFLANMTAIARVLPGIRDTGIADRFNFFDLAKMLGFTQLTISNGRDFAHQVIIE